MNFPLFSHEALLLIGVKRFLSAALMSVLISSGVAADEIRIAAASNFIRPLKAVSAHFKSRTGHKPILIFGSTGKLYAQIRNGAPFHVFLAADARRPQLLERDEIIPRGSRFTYAVGRIALWSPVAEFVDPVGRVLENGDFRHLAIANPTLAPYGKAAMETLAARGLWKKLRSLIVQGENIAQTYQFVKSGNASLGFVALSQIKRPDENPTGSYWEVPATLYNPIEQQGGVVKNTRAAKLFAAYLRGAEAGAIIRRFGYLTPILP